MSSLTRGISSNTSWYLSKAFCCFNCEIKFESIPPGIWYINTSVSILSLIGSIYPSYFSLRVSKYFLIWFNAFKSRPVSNSVPCNDATILSVGGWEVPQANGDIAVSKISTPA